jgi:hypothetical protein
MEKLHKQFNQNARVGSPYYATASREMGVCSERRAPVDLWEAAGN